MIVVTASLSTLSIDDDVLLAARSRAAREKRSVGDVISELAREALVSRAGSPAARRTTYKNGFVPIPSRGGVVTSELVHELLDADE